MKLDEDFGPDREDQFQTDDEENQAHTVCQDDTDTGSENTESDLRSLSNKSIDANNQKWPQSYRMSMDMLTGVSSPSISILKGGSAASITSSLTSVNRRHQCSGVDPFLTKPLVSAPSILNGGASTSAVPMNLTETSQLNLSSNELPSPERKSSVTQACFNGINVICGVGLLTTPYAVKEGGWSSLFILPLFAVVCCYTGILLARCLESSAALQTYPDIGQAAFGVTGRIAISIVLYIELYASSVEYVIMMSDNLSRLFPNIHMTFSGMNLDPHQLFTILATLIVLPTVWLRDLSLLSYLSVGGVGTSILVALCLLWVGTVDKVGFHPQGTVLDFANFPVAIGIYSFGFGGHSVFPNIYASMKEPSRLPVVLTVSFLFCGFMYAAVAICGFLMFGDSVESQYTLNMPEEFVASNIAIWTTVVNPMTKYALNMMPVALCLEELMPSGWLRSYSASLLVRTILVASTLVVALTVPFFGFVMALIGSLLGMLVGVIFPSACYVSLLRDRLTKLQIAACVCIIGIGVLCSCIGTYSSIAKIANEFS